MYLSTGGGREQVLCGHVTHSVHSVRARAKNSGPIYQMTAVKKKKKADGEQPGGEKEIKERTEGI